MCLCVGTGVRGRRRDGVWSGSTGVVSCIYGVKPFLTMGGFLAVSIRAALELLWRTSTKSHYSDKSARLSGHRTLRTPSQNLLVRVTRLKKDQKSIANIYMWAMVSHHSTFFFFLDWQTVKSHVPIKTSSIPLFVIVCFLGYDYGLTPRRDPDS